MKDLAMVESEENNKPSNNTDEIDDLLAEYNSGLNVEQESPAPEITTENNQPENVSSSDWHGNPAYYQTGNKAGQLRPSMKHKASSPEKMELQGSSLIDGALFIMLIDMLFPLIITALNNKFTNSKIKLEDLQLNDKQKKDLTPVADEVIKKLSLQANPVWLLVIAMSGIYGINYMAAKSAADDKPKKNER